MLHFKEFQLIFEDSSLFSLDLLMDVSGGDYPVPVTDNDEPNVHGEGNTEFEDWRAWKQLHLRHCRCDFSFLE